MTSPPSDLPGWFLREEIAARPGSEPDESILPSPPNPYTIVSHPTNYSKGGGGGWGVILGWGFPYYLKGICPTIIKGVPELRRAPTAPFFIFFLPPTLIYSLPPTLHWGAKGAVLIDVITIPTQPPWRIVGRAAC